MYCPTVSYNFALLCAIFLFHSISIYFALFWQSLVPQKGPHGIHIIACYSIPWHCMHCLIECIQFWIVVDPNWLPRLLGILALAERGCSGGSVRAWLIRVSRVRRSAARRRTLCTDGFCWPARAHAFAARLPAAQHPKGKCRNPWERQNWCNSVKCNWIF